MATVSASFKVGEQVTYVEYATRRAIWHGTIAGLPREIRDAPGENAYTVYAVTLATGGDSTWNGDRLVRGWVTPLTPWP